MAADKTKPADAQQDQTEARAEKPTKAKSADAHEELVEMSRGGEVLQVHPSCVADHERIGFKAV